jgi:hypothetical protein
MNHIYNNLGMKFLPFTLRIVILTCCFALSFSACKSAAKTAENTVDTGGLLYREEISIPLWDGKESPSLQISLKLLDPAKFALAGKAGGEAAFRNIVQEQCYGGLSPREYAEAIEERQRGSYLAMRETTQEHPDIPSEALDWFYNEEFEVSLLTQNLAVIVQNRDYYTGGAHGMREKRYFVFDTGKALRIFPGDIILPNREGDLAGRIEAGLRKDWDLQSGEDLKGAGFFESTVSVPENFFLSPQGLGYHWDPYEIAPYVMGDIELVLPYGEIKDLLSPLGQSLAREAGAK